jgi:NDP-sugar pyrophosphorylase family protein
MKAVVLCGGLGTRLGPLTRETPKPLLDIGGKPFITNVLDHLAANGTTEIVLAVSFQWQKLRDALGETWRGLPLHYSVEAEPLGTGGAVRQAMHQMGWTEAIVANGDTLLRMDPRLLRDAASQHSADLVLALIQVNDASRYGCVRVGVDSRVLEFEEKGQSGKGLINAGLYWIRAGVLDKGPDGVFSLERDLMAAQVNDLAMYGVATSSYFIDMGIPEDLERARRELS